MRDFRKYLKIFTIILGTLISLIILLLSWFYLPYQWKYYTEIKQGNLYIERINYYKKIHRSLPKETDWKLLDSLNPIKPSDNFYPQYIKINDFEFELIYIEGFDPPFVRYNSKSEKWVYQ